MAPARICVVSDRCDAAEDEDAEPAASDGGRDGGRADGGDGGDADARNDGGRGQRQLHFPEQLTAGHAHGDGGFAHGGVDAQDSGERVAKNRKQRVEHQRDDGGALADAADEAEWGSGIRRARGWGWSA